MSRGKECDKSDVPFVFFPIEKSPTQKPLQLMNLTQALMLPWELKRKIDEKGGHDIKMLIQKKLFKSDLSSYHSRLSIPENNIQKEAIDFLKKEEVELLERRVTSCKLAGLPVLVLDPSLREFNLLLKKWPMKRTSIYNLTSQWNNIVDRNDFKVDDEVQLWSFRSLNDQLCFALVKL